MAGAVVVGSLSNKLYSHCFSLPSCLNRNLASTGKAAHPAVTSVGTCMGLTGDTQLSMSQTVGKGPGGILSARNFTCETPVGY